MMLAFALYALQSENLTLRCEGHRMVMAASGATTAGAIDNQGNVVTGNSTNLVPTEVVSVAEFRMANGTAQLFLPPEAQPPMAFRGPRDWMPVRDLVANDREITGRIRFGITENVRFTINRIDGTLVTNAGRWHCAPVDTSKRAF